MSAFTSRAAETVERLAEAYGGPVTLRRVTLGAYDDATRRQATGHTDYPLGFGRLQAQVLADAQGNLVQTDKSEVVVPSGQLPAGVVPLTSDLVVLSGQQYEILAIRRDGFPAYKYRLEVMA